MTDYILQCSRCRARIEFDTRDGRLVERHIRCVCPPGQAMPVVDPLEPQPCRGGCGLDMRGRRSDICADCRDRMAVETAREMAGPDWPVCIDCRREPVRTPRSRRCVRCAGEHEKALERARSERRARRLRAQREEAA